MNCLFTRFNWSSSNPRHNSMLKGLRRISFKVEHRNCWSELLYDPRVSAVKLKEMVYDNPKYIWSAFQFEALADGFSLGRHELLGLLRSHPTVVNIRCLTQLSKNSFVVELYTTFDNSMSSVMYRHRVPLFWQRLEEGKESWVLITDRPTANLIKKEISELAGLLRWDERAADPESLIQMMGSGIGTVYSSLNLTPMERKAATEAYRTGYFNYPHSARLEDLSKEMGLSKTTLSFHLRNAERKLFGLLLNQSPSSN
jgi:predicted DNA binding protein